MDRRPPLAPASLLCLCEAGLAGIGSTDFVENSDPHLLDVGVNLVKLDEVAEGDCVLRPPILLPRSEQYFPGGRLVNDLG